MKSIIWQCPICGDIQVSHSREHHNMNICKCNNSGVDLEEYYWRVIWDIIVLKEFDDDEFPFGLELYHDILEQFPERTICKQYITLEDSAFIHKLKNELYMEVYL
jgi:hypothetical protein